MVKGAIRERGGPKREGKGCWTRGSLDGAERSSIERVLDLKLEGLKGERSGGRQQVKPPPVSKKD